MIISLNSISRAKILIPRKISYSVDTTHIFHSIVPNPEACSGAVKSSVRSSYPQKQPGMTRPGHEPTIYALSTLVAELSHYPHTLPKDIMYLDM